MPYAYLRNYVGQIHPDGWGWDDCGPATGAWIVCNAGKLSASRESLDLINEMCLAMRGHSDSPDNGYTYSDQLVAGLAKYGIQSHWSDSYQEAHDAPWSMVVVNYEVRLADGSYDYDPGALGGGTHIMGWGPDGRGMDPLAMLTAATLVQWDYASLQSVFVGAIIIDSVIGTPYPPLPPAPPPHPSKSKRTTVKQQVGLKGKPTHGGPDLVKIPAHAAVLDSGTRKGGWADIMYGVKGKGYWGWVEASALV